MDQNLPEPSRKIPLSKRREIIERSDILSHHRARGLWRAMRELPKDRPVFAHRFYVWATRENNVFPSKTVLISQKSASVKNCKIRELDRSAMRLRNQGYRTQSSLKNIHFRHAVKVLF